MDSDVVPVWYSNANLEGNRYPVWSVCADQVWLFSGDERGNIIAESVEVEMQTLEGHAGPVLALYVSGDRLFSGGLDQTIRVWRIVDEIWQLDKILEGHTGAVLTLCVSGDRLFSGGIDQTIKVWDLAGECVQTLQGHADWVSSVCVSGDRLFSGSRTIKVWRFVDEIWQLDKTLGGHTVGVGGHAVKMLTLCVSGRRLFSGGTDGMIKVWDWKSGGVQTLGKHDDEVLSMCVFGDQLFSTGEDNTLRVWDLQVGYCVEIWVSAAFQARCLFVFPDGDNPNGGTLFAACDDGNVRGYRCGGEFAEAPYERPNSTTPYVSLRF